MQKSILFTSAFLLFAMASMGQDSKTYHRYTYHKGRNNIISIAPISAVTGAYPLFYERRITRNFSLQLGGGITRKDYARAYFEKDNDLLNTTYPWANPNYVDISPRIYNFIPRMATTGYLYSIQPRFYFSNAALRGAFISFSYDFYRYNFSIPSILDSTSPSGYTQNGPLQKEYENIQDIMFYAGYQYVYRRLTIDYFFGFGERKINGVKYAAAVDAFGNITDGFAAYKETTINFNGGIKMGVHF